MAESDEKQRVSELEAEVASLRAKLGEGSEGGVQLRESDDAQVPADSRVFAKEFTPQPSRAKVILLSLVVVFVGLALMFGIFVALSKGFDRFADNAAKQLVPARGKKPLPPPTTKLAPGMAPPAKAPAKLAPDAGAPKEQIVVPGI